MSKPGEDLVPGRKIKPGLFWLAAAILLVVAVALGAFVMNNASRGTGENRARRSVAVLGFRNSTGQADAAWLSTALAEMLTTEMAAGEKLRAIPGETVARMQSELSLPDEAGSFAPETLARIRNYLGADVLVYGSYVVSSGTPSRVRMDLRLQDSVH
jgi:TolB-like protein